MKHPVILFDGVCNLCNSSVNFIIDRDRGKYRFASLQSNAAQQLLRERGVEPSNLESILLLTDEQVYDRSEAALRIAANLRGLWPVLSVFRILPKSLRDFVYKFIARNRYRWFGKTDSCRMPSPHLIKRFLDY